MTPALGHRFRASRRLASVAGGCLLACLAGGAVLAAGCAGGDGGPVAPDEPELIAPGSFKIGWRTRVDPQAGVVDEIYLRGDLLIAYTDRKRVQAISAGGGRTRFIRNVVPPGEVLYPPVRVPTLNRVPEAEEVIAFPVATGFVLVDLEGRTVGEASVERNLTTPAASEAGVTYVGVADERGGRLVKVDPFKPAGEVLERVLLEGALAAKPATFGSFIYAADLAGRVYGLTEELTQAWDPPYYATEPGRGVQADLAADDYGVYVAGTDGVLNVLRRDSGRLLWRYISGQSLFEPPVPTDEWVYQAVLGRGVVALPKFEGSRNSREPAWTADDALAFLSHDDQNVYLLQRDGRIAAHDKETGDRLFLSERNDFTRFARNVGGPRIYAANPAGEVVAIDPVLGRGEVGEVALLPASVLP